MDKTTKELRARLRTELAKWLDHAIKCRAASEQRREIRRRLHRGDELQLMSADRMRRIEIRLLLEHLAANQTIGLLVSQLEERRPLKVVGSIVPENPYTVAPDSLPPAEWTIARPGRDSPLLPQTIDDPLIVWDIVVEAIIPEWLDHLDTEAPSADGLTPNARAFLLAMLDLKLHDGTRAGQGAIWARVAERGNAVEGKSDRAAAVGILKDSDLIDSKSGTGTKLTTRGVAMARSLSSRSNPQ